MKQVLIFMVAIAIIGGVVLACHEAYNPKAFEVIPKQACTDVVGTKQYQRTLFGIPLDDPEAYVILKDGREIERWHLSEHGYAFEDRYCETVYAKKS